MKETKKVMVTFRMTETETELLMELMKVSNEGSRSDYIRGIVLSNLDQVTTAIT